MENKYLAITTSSSQIFNFVETETSFIFKIYESPIHFRNNNLQLVSRVKFNKNDPRLKKFISDINEIINA